MGFVTFLSHVWCVLCAVNFITVNGRSEIVESEVRDYAKLYKKTLDDHLEEKLELSKVRRMIADHENELGIRTINGSKEFQRIFQTMQLRYTDLERSIYNLHSTIENNLPVPPTPVGPVPGTAKNTKGTPNIGPTAHTPPGLPGNNNGPPPIAGSGSPISAKRCCSKPGSRVYAGRFREEVSMEECYEQFDDTLKGVRDIGIVDAMKTNLRTDSSVTWQYYVSTDGHYIQYPTNDKACDKRDSSLNSPFVEEWFVQKLRMERKNLVLLVDHGPGTRQQLIADAVKRTLATLTIDDKVNVVIFPYGTPATGVVPGCSKGLLVATDANKNLLAEFVKRAPGSNTEPRLLEGLTAVYDLLEHEQLENEVSFERRVNLVMLLVDGTSNPTDLTGTPLLELMARYQLKLNNSVQHLVYLLGESANVALVNRMGQIADQNNLKPLVNDQNTPQPWTPIPGLVSNGQPVGKEGSLTVVKDIQTYPDHVSKYFQFLPAKADTTNDVTMITPILDNTSGIKMTLTRVIYNHSNVAGVVAVDSSLGTVFSEIENFDVGLHSYMYLLDLNHGHVLMHPKLRDPDETAFDDTIFPRLELIEPDLTTTERTILMKSSVTMAHFETTQLKRVRSLISGELTSDPPDTPTPATVYYRRLPGTHLCVVLVHFSTDGEEARLQVNTGLSNVKFHAPYHRLDKTVLSPVENKPDRNLTCHLYGHYVSFKESVIKLSPSVFSESERYKYKRETTNDILQVNAFLTGKGNTSLVREDAKALILQTVRATDGMDSLWKVSSKDVIDRFYGSTSGVFRLFPGTPLQNNFDHMKTDWYQRSIASVNTTFYHYGKLTGVTRTNVVIVSRAVTEQRRLQGVLGLTVTLRFFTSQLLNSVRGCVNSNLTCHAIDASGYILDASLLNNPDQRHISKTYPWLFKELIDQRGIQVDRCTGFSDGYHKVLFSIKQKRSQDIGNPDRCRHYRLEPACSSCSSPASFDPRFQLNLPRCQSCQSNNSQCQCQCYCVTEFDTCHGQFKTQVDDFPLAACFYKPVLSSQPELQPDSPGPMFEHCTIPCAAIEDMTTCSNLSHCKISTDVYPVCIWKDDNEMRNVTESKFLPTTAAPSPPPFPTQPVNGAPTPPILKQTDLTRASTNPIAATHPSGTSPPMPDTVKASSTHTAVTPPVLGTSTNPTDLRTLSLPATTVPPLLGISTKSTDLGTLSSPTMNVPPLLGKSTAHIVSPPVLSTNSGLVPPVLAPSTAASVASSKSVNSTDGQSSTVDSSRTATDSHVSTMKTVSDTDSISPNTGRTNILSVTSDDSGQGMGGGKIAATVIGVLAFVIIALIILMKVYAKKFRTADSSKYLAGNTIFHSSFFNRSAEEVTLSTAPSHTTFGYKEMTD